MSWLLGWIAKREYWVERSGATLGSPGVRRSIHIEANSTDCDWSAAKMGLNVLGPDFTFADGTRLRQMDLDPPVNADFIVAFTPTAEGEESIVITSYRVCGPPGTRGEPGRTR